jgi:DNA repair protein RadC
MKATTYKFSTFEVRVQRVQECPGSLKVDAPEHAVSYWREKLPSASWFDPEREMVVAVMLNTRLAATGHSLVSIGSLNESIVHPRDVFRAAVTMGSYAIVLMHNHPSGDPSPSEADRRVTIRMREAGDLLGIRLLDHVIVGNPQVDARGHFSFREAGLL